MGHASGMNVLTSSKARNALENDHRLISLIHNWTIITPSIFPRETPGQFFFQNVLIPDARAARVTMIFCSGERYPVGSVASRGSRIGFSSGWVSEVERRSYIQPRRSERRRHQLMVRNCRVGIWWVNLICEIDLNICWGMVIWCYMSIYNC